MPEQPAVAHSEFAFDVFISYSRRDRYFADRLERALEAYDPPRGLAVPQRGLRVFRDEGDLTGSEYFRSIERYLQDSRKLLVVCSPEARKSRYVSDEIERFVALRGAEHVVAVLLQGLPDNEVQPGREEERAFPQALLDALRMPLAVPYAGIGPRESVRRGRFEGSWYTVLANLYGVSREEIEQRDRRRRERRMIALTTVAVVVGIVMLSLAGWALVSRAAAVRERRLAVSRLLAAHAEMYQQQGRSFLARSLLLAAQSVRRYPTVEGSQALMRALSLMPPLVVELRHSKRIEGLAFSPDGGRLATASVDGTWSVVDVANRVQLASDRHAGGVNGVQFGSDGRRLFVAGKDGVTVTVLEPRDRPTTALASAEADGFLVAADGRRLLVASGVTDLEITARNLPAGPIVELGAIPAAVGGRAGQAVEQTVTAVAFSPDGAHLVVGYTNGVLRLFSVVRWRMLWEQKLPQEVDCASFSADGTRLAVADATGTVHVLDVAMRREEIRLAAHCRVWSVAGPDQGFLGTGCGDGTASVWRVVDGKEMARVVVAGGTDPSPSSALFGDPVTALAFAPGTALLAAGDWAGRIGVWDVRALLRSRNANWQGRITAFASDANVFVRTELEPAGVTVVVHDLSGDALARHPTGQGSIVALALSADGRRLAMAGLEDYSSERDPQTGRWSSSCRGCDVRLFEVAPWREVWRKPRGDDYSTALAFGPGEGELAVSREDGIHVLRVSDGSEARVVPGAGGERLAFSRDGTWLASARTVSQVVRQARLETRLWDTRSGRAVLELAYPASNSTIAAAGAIAAFAPDGRHLATGVDGRSAAIWDLRTRSEVARIRHEDVVTSVSFSADGRHVLSAGRDGTARILSLDQMAEVARIYHGAEVWPAARFDTTSDRKVIVFDTDGFAERWSWRPEDAVEEACLRVSTDLSAEEWRASFGAEAQERTCPATSRFTVRPEEAGPTDARGPPPVRP